MASPINLGLISLTYFFYFGQLGVFIPYVAVFLDGRGLSSEEIGSLLAIVTLTRVLGPNLWANVADRTGRGADILRFGCLLGFLAFNAIYFTNSFWGLTFAFGLMMMFWTAVLPQLEVITVNATKTTKGGYGAIRLWGSIGFVALSLVVGSLLDYFSSDVIVVCSSVTLFALYLASLFIASPSKLEHSNTSHSASSNWQEACKLPFIIFMLSASLLQMSFGSYYNFFALYMVDLDYSGKQTGLFISIGVVAEIAIFLVATRVISRFGVKWIMLISMLLTTCRWLTLALLPEYLSAILLSQTLHAFSFGMTHAASVHFLHHYFCAEFQSRAQALYVSIAFGVGGAIGSYISGKTWLQGEGAEFSFMLSASFAFASALILVFFSDSESKKKPDI
ncbi:MFS transporter [Glaciecola sp. MH2013]|nr:MFS transporter [Glaciecola sp. MH2013]